MGVSVQNTLTHTHRHSVLLDGEYWLSMFVSLPLIFIDQTLFSCGYIAWLKSEILLKCGCVLTIELCRLSKHLTGPIRPECLSQDQGLSVRGMAVAMVTRMVIVMCFPPDVIVT